MRKSRTAILAVLLVGAGLISGCGDDLKGIPDVTGLSLPDAKQQLRTAGYSTSVTSDALFGVIIEQNFTVCKEHAPKGKLVPIEVSKQC